MPNFQFLFRSCGIQIFYYKSNLLLGHEIKSKKNKNRHENFACDKMSQFFALHVDNKPSQIMKIMDVRVCSQNLCDERMCLRFSVSTEEK